MADRAKKQVIILMLDDKTPLPQNILVTGADGMIGRAVAHHLQAAGVTVSGLSTQWSEPPLFKRLHTGDAADPVLVGRALNGVDAVVHLAAIPSPAGGQPLEVFGGNTAATFNVLSQAGQRGIRRAVIASSINAFGVPMNHHPVLPAYFPLDEDIPVAHDDWYSLSKHTDEQTARMCHSRWGIDVVAIRFPYVRPHAKLLGYVDELDDEVTRAKLVREGWSYLDLRDAVGIVLAGLTADLSGDRSGAHVVMAAADDMVLAEETEAMLDRYAPDVPRRRAFFGRGGLVDTTRARTLLGWAPQHSIHRPTVNGAPAYLSGAQA